MDSQLQSRIDLINSRLSIPDVLPLKLGTETCPKCSKKEMTVYANNLKCWRPSCEWNEGVSLIKAYQVMHGYEYKGGFFKALAELEARIGIDSVKSSKKKPDSFIVERDLILSRVLDLYQLYLKLDVNPHARKWLNSRGFSDRNILEYKIGYAPNKNSLKPLIDKAPELKKYLLEIELINNFNQKEVDFFSNRIIFPIYDENNYLVHFQGRWLGKIPVDSNGTKLCAKYKDSKNEIAIKSSKSFLALEHLLKVYSNKQKLYICEGYPDALTLNKLGLNSVGLLGLANLNTHKDKLQKFSNLVFIFDNDRYEVSHPRYPLQFKSWSKILPQIIRLQTALPSTNFEIWMPPIDSGCKDINDLYIKRGSTIKESILNGSVNLLDYLIDDWGSQIERHKQLISLLNSVTKLKDRDKKQYYQQLLNYIPNNLNQIEYASLILQSP